VTVKISAPEGRKAKPARKVQRFWNAAARGFMASVVRFVIVGCAILGFVVGHGVAGQETQELPSAPQPQQDNQQGQDKQNQDKQDQDKKEDQDKTQANPAAVAAQKVAEATENLGALALVKARRWENSWLTGVYVEKDAPLYPLTAGQRSELYLQQTLATPGAYVKRMFAAGIDQARGTPYQWGGGWEGYGRRFASREGQFIIANSLAAMGNAALQYEPRYDQCWCSGFKRRTGHAIFRNFFTYDRSESELRLQLALYAGAFGGGVASTAWKPGRHSPWAEGSYAMAEQGAWGTLLNLFIEFSSDINRKIDAWEPYHRSKKRVGK
jgi:hypothetical protein